MGASVKGVDALIMKSVMLWLCGSILRLKGIQTLQFTILSIFKVLLHESFLVFHLSNAEYLYDDHLLPLWNNTIVEKRWSV